MYSVEDSVHPPQRDNHRRGPEDLINQDLEENSARLNSGHHNQDTPEASVNKAKGLDDALGQESERMSKITGKRVEGVISPNIGISGKRKSPFTVSKKSYRSKITTVSKEKRSRVSRRGGSMETSSNTRAQTGAIGMAMKVLNMDEEEKEMVYFSTTEHNIKMKDQLQVLFSKLDLVEAFKTQQGSTKRGDYFTLKDEAFREKDLEVGKILRKMKKVKAQINVMRKQLRMSYDGDKLTELENERKAKTKKWNKLKQENEKLKTTKAKHLREIASIENEGNWTQRKDVLVNELRESKTESRSLYYNNLEKKKDLINKHENVVLLDKKIRNMQKLTDVKQKVSPKEEDKKEDSGIEDLDEKVKQATKAMEVEEKRNQIEIHKQKAEISNLEHLVEIAALKLREKEQENRL
mmetsp:Transcript_9299/g.8960  ORF Transcript_9299/g.8960 Transcript_9299/m.8960 type:complete len:408 (+) Transcript_9299:1-1224(+)